MLNSGVKIVFAGDSVTDCGRRLDATSPLGKGFVSLVAESLAKSLNEVLVVNSGINGDRSRDLLGRWETDVLDAAPNVISIMIGINDTWRRYDQQIETTAEVFESNCRSMIERSLAGSQSKIVLMEPFLLPVTADQGDWMEDLEPKIAAIDQLAAEFKMPLLKTHEFMTQSARIHGAQALAPDGVHPSALGHEILAAQWLEMMA